MKINAILAMYANWLQDTGGSDRFRLDENGAAEALQSYIDSKIIEARKETVLHFRKVAQHQKDRGYGCDRILGETNIMAKNKWKALNHRKDEHDNRR